MNTHVTVGSIRWRILKHLFYYAGYPRTGISYSGLDPMEDTETVEIDGEDAWITLVTVGSIRWRILKLMN